MFNEFFENIASIPEQLAKAISRLGENPITLVVIAVLLVGVFALLRTRKIQFTTHLITQMAISIAIAAVLNMLIIYRMPQGGSVTLASMVPIYLLSFAYGPEVGMLSGFLFGIVDLMLGASIYHPMQVLLDYPIPFMFVGLAGLLPRHANLGMFLGTSIRLISHVLSGYIFFAEYAPEGTHPLLYSITYNGSFLLADLAIAMIVMNILPLSRLLKALNPKAPPIKMW